jgi:23S rRNA pseudouridine1911/1915/1917 synthase
MPPRPHTPQDELRDVDRHSLVVAAEEAGARIDRYLAGVLPGHSRSQIQRLIKDGKVQIADQSVRSNRTVRAGDEIVVDVPEPVSPAPQAEALDLDIVYQDSDLVVVDKPAGMVVHPAAGHAQGTLVNALLHQIKDLSGIGGELRPGIVHRLDRGTSGLMVVAKNDGAHVELARQFHDREVEKAYIALVWGIVQPGRRIDLPIGRDPIERKKMSATARRARSATTRITKSLQLPGVSLLHVAISTGRTHQIRVHLSAIGHPIVGDSVYGGLRRRVPGDLRPVLGLKRPFLHAARLVFHHPSDGRKMEFESPLPADLQSVLDKILPEDYE